MMNKKGSTLSNWVFVILGISLILVLFQSQILSPMNEMYGGNNDIGLSDDALNTINNLSTRASIGNSEVAGGSVETTSDGLTWTESFSVAKGIFQTLSDFASGRFLRKLMVEQLDFPEIVPTVITILIWMSLIFIMIRIFLRGITP